jgi:hypothetical protein
VRTQTSGARMREESPRARRPIEPGELHRAGVGWPPRLSGALGTFGAAPRPHRVRRLRARGSGGAPGNDSSGRRRAIRPARTTAELIAAVQKPLVEPSAFSGTNRSNGSERRANERLARFSASWRRVAQLPVGA